MTKTQNNPDPIDCMNPVVEQPSTYAEVSIPTNELLSTLGSDNGDESVRGWMQEMLSTVAAHGRNLQQMKVQERRERSAITQGETGAGRSTCVPLSEIGVNGYVAALAALGGGAHLSWLGGGNAATPPAAPLEPHALHMSSPGDDQDTNAISSICHTDTEDSDTNCTADYCTAKVAADYVPMSKVPSSAHVDPWRHEVLEIVSEAIELSASQSRKKCTVVGTPVAAYCQDSDENSSDAGTNATATPEIVYVTAEEEEDGIHDFVDGFMDWVEKVLMLPSTAQSKQGLAPSARKLELENRLRQCTRTFLHEFASLSVATHTTLTCAAVYLQRCAVVERPPSRGSSVAYSPDSGPAVPTRPASPICGLSAEDRRSSFTCTDDASSAQTTFTATSCAWSGTAGGSTVGSIGLPGANSQKGIGIAVLRKYVLAALVVSCKAYTDHNYRMKEFAETAEIPLPMLRTAELQLLKTMQYSALVSTDEFDQMRAQLDWYAARTNNADLSE